MMISDAARQALAGRQGMLIGGEFCAASAGEVLPTFDPASEAQLALIPRGRAEDVDRAVAAARTAFKDERWSAAPAGRRKQVLWRVAELIERDCEVLAQLESLDNGKPITAAAAGDVPGAAAVFRYWAGWCGMLSGRTLTPDHPGEFLAMTLREPVGVVGLIIPWNFPLLSAAAKLGPALAAGCTMVLKPAEQTSLTALHLGQLLMEAGVPAGVVNIVTGLGMEAGMALAAHTDVDKISFTGSTAVGKSLLTAAQGNLKRLTLELGGKSPNVILEDADLSKAIPGAANGIFRNAGQVCAAGSRLIVHRSVFDRVAEGVLEQAKAHRLGPGLDPQTTMGPLVSQAQRARVDGYVDDARKSGASVQAGGQPLPNAGHFVAPTMILEAKPDARVWREEIFGPVLVLTRFDDLDAAVSLADDTNYGLNANVWTRDLSTAHRLARRIRAGTVNINCVSAAGPNLPMGGYRQSGWGREGGLEGLEAYTELKTVAVAL